MDFQKIDVIGIWISPAGKLVGTYGVCSACTKTMSDAPKRLQSVLMDRVEQRLLNRFPELFKKLPGLYSPGKIPD